MDEIRFIAELADILEVDRDELTEESKLDPDRWDSVAHLTAIAMIDESFGFTVPAAELTSCQTVGAVVTLLRFHLEKGPQ